MHATLETLMQYSNEDVISRFTDLFNVSEAEAGDIFNETKKFLYICRRPGVFIPDELLILDEMWHNFILFTAQYQEFCLRYFGIYIHHTPASKAEKIKHRDEVAADLMTARNDFSKKLGTLMAVTYDELGQDTMVKWFKQYPVQYSKQAIKNLRKN